MNEKQTILIVDDNEDLRDTTAKMIESFGFNTILASNGNECIFLYDKFQPDLVLMDVKMPEKDGYDTFFELQKNIQM